MVANAKKWLGSDPVEFILRVIIGVTAMVCLILFARQNSLSNCQYKYNQTYAEYALDSRDTRESDDKVRDELFRSIYNARNLTSNEAQRAVDAAFVKYFTTVEMNAKQRKDNPPPPLPSAYCR